MGKSEIKDKKEIKEVNSKEEELKIKKKEKKVKKDKKEKKQKKENKENKDKKEKKTEDSEKEIKDKKRKKNKQEKESKKKLKEEIKDDIQENKPKISSPPSEAVKTKSGNDWHSSELSGDANRKLKFLKLMGANKAKNLETKSGGSKVLDSTQQNKVYQQLEKQFEQGLQYKKAVQSGKRKGLGA